MHCGLHFHGHRPVLNPDRDTRLLAWWTAERDTGADLKPNNTAVNLIFQWSIYYNGEMCIRLEIGEHSSDFRTVQKLYGP